MPLDFAPTPPGEDGAALTAATLALELGWDVALIAPGGPEAAPFPGISYHRNDPASALAAIGLDRWTAIAVLSHDREDDERGLAAAMLQRAALLEGRREIEAVLIDSSNLVRRLGNFYSFDLVLKNSAALPLAVPALELSLTDTRDNVIVRRVFLPAELPGAPEVLPAQGAVSMSLRGDLGLMRGDAIESFRIKPVYYVGDLPWWQRLWFHMHSHPLLLALVGIGTGLLLTFMFVGQSFLKAMSLSDVSLQIGGAVVLFLIALRMIFPPPPQDSPVPLAEPLIVPLAIPALAGPSAMATVLLLVSQAPERRLEWVAALTVTMVVCAGVLLMAERLQQVVGERVVSAFERLMGLILVSISVEMLIRGLQSLALRWPHA